MILEGKECPKMGKIEKIDCEIGCECGEIKVKVRVKDSNSLRYYLMPDGRTTKVWLKDFEGQVVPMLTKFNYDEFIDLIEAGLFKQLGKAFLKADKEYRS